MEKILETMVIDGAEFTVVEKPATVYAGCRSTAPDEESEPALDGACRFEKNLGKIKGSLTPDTLICLSINYKEHNHGEKAILFLMHCQEVSEKDQPQGIDVLEIPSCLLIKVKASEAAWALTKKLTGEDNPQFHMAPLFGLIETLFCGGDKPYRVTPDFSGTCEIEYYNNDNSRYAAISAVKA